MSNYSLSDLKPIEWLPIEQMKVGDSGLLVLLDDSIVPGELLENDIVKVYDVDDVTLEKSEAGLLHISEIKLFSTFNKESLH